MGLVASFEFSPGRGVSLSLNLCESRDSRGFLLVSELGPFPLLLALPKGGKVVGGACVMWHKELLCGDLGRFRLLSLDFVILGISRSHSEPLFLQLEHGQYIASEL